MPIDVGTARVIITGDYSKLTADFATAQGIASAGARNIGNAVSTSFAGASLIVDQFGRSIVASTEAVVAAEPPVLDLEGGIIRLAIAQEMLAIAAQNAASATSHEVSEMQAASAAIRVGLGEHAIRAVERLLTMIPGLGTALKYAFPVVGAIALGEAVYHVAQNFTGLKEAQEALKRSEAEVDEAFEKTISTIERVQAEAQSLDFGAASGKRIEAFYTEGSAERDRARVKGLGIEVNELVRQMGQFKLIQMIPLIGAQSIKADEDRIRTLQNQQQKLLADAETKDAEAALKRKQAAIDEARQTGQLGASRIQATESALSHQTTLARSIALELIETDHAAAQSKINAMHDTEAAAVASAAEELQVAQNRERELTDIIGRETLQRIELIRRLGAEEARGKTGPEQAVARVNTARQVQDAEADAAEKIQELSASTSAAQGKYAEASATYNRKAALESDNFWREAFDKIAAGAHETQTIIGARATAIAGAMARSIEIEARSQGEVRQIELEGQKLTLERQYGVEVGHTLAQQISYMTDLAAIDQRAREARIDGLRQELAIAEAIEDEGDRKARVAQIQGEINRLEAQSRNASYAAQTRIDETRKKAGLGSELGNAGESGARSLGNSLANSIAGSGKSIGNAIKESLTGIGKQMLGDIFTKAIEQMVIAITGNTIATNLNTVWTELQALIPHPFGFAGGGRPAAGIPYIVGENGPELRIDDGPGTIIPSGMFALPNRTSGVVQHALAAGGSIGGSSTSFHFGGDLHFHGVQNVRDMMRQISDVARNSSFANAPATR